MLSRDYVSSLNTTRHLWMVTTISGCHHAGIKYLIPIDRFTGYVGASYEVSGSHTTLENPLFVVGIETLGDVRFYAEHITSVVHPGEGSTSVGVKFVF